MLINRGHSDARKLAKKTISNQTRCIESMHDTTQTERNSLASFTERHHRYPKSLFHHVNIQDRDLERDLDLAGDFFLTSSKLSLSLLSSTVESVIIFFSRNFFVWSKRIS